MEPKKSGGACLLPPLREEEILMWLAASNHGLSSAKLLTLTAVTRQPPPAPRPVRVNTNYFEYRIVQEMFPNKRVRPLE